MNQLIGKFQMLWDAADQINRILNDPGDWNLLAEKLDHRQTLLNILRSDIDVLDESKKKNNLNRTSIKKLMVSIKELDTRNMDLIRSAIDKTSHSLVELTKERATVKALRSMTKMGHMQLVDFLH